MLAAARIWFLSILLFAATAARANLSDDVHGLLVHEQFEPAASMLQAAMAQASGDSIAEKRARLDALHLMLDMAVLRNTEQFPNGQELVDQIIALENELHGADSPGLAKPLAYAAIRNLHDQHFRVGGEQSKQAQALVDKGKVNAVDRAYILTVASSYLQLHGRLDQAEVLMEQAVKPLLPLKTDWQRVAYLHALVKLAEFQGRNGKVQSAVINAKTGAALAAKVVGPQSLMCALSRTTLGDVLYFQGDYVGSRDAIEPALAILRQRTDADTTREFAANTLAGDLRAMGDMDGARRIYAEALARAKEKSGPRASIDVSVQMNFAAETEMEAGNEAGARRMLEEILAHEEQSPQGEQNPHLYPPLSNLGMLALRAGEIDAADKYFTRALAVLNATVGEDNGYSVENLEALGEVALARGNPVEAQRWLEKATDVQIRTYGKYSPPYQQIQCELALAKARQNNIKSAFEIAEGVETERAHLLNRFVPALGEGQALRFKRALDSCDGLLLTLAAQRDDSDVASRAWRLQAETRGLATRLQIARIAAARRSASPEIRARLSEWEHAVQAYANALVLAKTTGGGDSEDAAKGYQRVEAAEAALGRNRAKFSLDSERALENTGVESWLATLGDGATLVAYIKSNSADISASARSLNSNEEHFYAFVASAHAEPRLIDLGRASEIEALAVHWYGLLSRADAPTAEMNAAGLAVRKVLWDALALNQAGRVFIVPDGVVYRLNFAALPDGDGFLLERGWRFHTLETESDAKPLLASKQPAGKLLLVGALDFGNSTTALSPARSGECAGKAARSFQSLPGAAAEMTELARLWKSAGQVTELSGARVTEASVHGAAMHADIVHFATHAFDLGSNCGESTATRGVNVSAEVQPAPTSATPTSLHQAALALSNANLGLATGGSEGLLTSEQVVAYSMANVSWVILAACETGLGDVIGDEGVFGLRRAFRLAGAHTVVMSLWSIDDAATTGWMVALYRARLEHKDTIDAMASAQLDSLASRRAQNLSAHPYFWAGFVAAGDWR